MITNNPVLLAQIIGFGMFLWVGLYVLARGARRTPLIAALPKMLFPFLVILPGMIALVLGAGSGGAGQKDQDDEHGRFANADAQGDRQREPDRL